MEGRQNNFNLLRMLAAFAVLISHSFALSQGLDAQPTVAGQRLGAFAVDVFFVTSGYLVTASVMRRTLVEFVAARVLRIYPALIVAVSVTVLVAYLHTGQLAADYWWRNALLFPGAPGTIEGVFTDNPHGDAVNGSLWTLPYEVRMYAALALLWLISARSPRVFRVLTPTLACICLAAELALGWTLTHLAWMFFAGAAMCVVRLRMAWAVAVLSIALLAVVAPLVPAVYLLALPYAVIAAAHIPGLTIYNRLGDYSYGVYIYAFPVQQTLVAMGLETAHVFVGTTLVTLPLAVASWHLVEKRALRWKEHVSRSPVLRSFRRPPQHQR